MADQGVRYVVTLSDINVVSGLRNMNAAANSAQASIASLNAELKGVASALGVGLGLHGLIAFGKEAVQGAADYETAVKRIKFASENLVEGANNIAFISSEADKFKIPIQEATDAYGKFLAMLSGSGISSGEVRKLHDELLLIGKVKGLDDGQMNAAVMNLGKMLESGSLDARHFRPLEQQLSGIGAFVAKELGITVHELAVLRNKGKMTTIDPKVLLTAIEKQAQSLEQFVPESVTTIRSQLNELDNAWLRFKNDLVFDNQDELKNFFGLLKDGIGWLSDHRDAIENVAGLTLAAGKAWLVYKAGLMAVNGVNAIFGINTTRNITAIAAESSAMTGLNAQLALLNEQLTAFIALQTSATAATLSFAEKRAFLNSVAGISNIPLNMQGLGIGAAGMGASAAAGLTAGVGAAIPYVAIAYFTGEAINQMVGRIGEKGPMPYDFSVWDLLKTGNDNAVMKTMLALATEKAQRAADAAADAKLINDPFVRNQYDSFDPITGKITRGSMFLDTGTAGNTKEKKGSGNYMPPTDTIKSQRAVTYNIEIKEMNGIKQNTVQAGANFDPKSVALELRDIMVSVVNDSQIRAGG